MTLRWWCPLDALRLQWIHIGLVDDVGIVESAVAGALFSNPRNVRIRLVTWQMSASEQENTTVPLFRLPSN